MNWFDIADKLIQLVAVLIGSGTAVYTVSVWRREHVGKRRMELAEDVLVLFYRARDAITHMRGVFGHSNEGSSRKSTEQESPEVKAERDYEYIIDERYEKHQDVFNELDVKRYRVVALFGKDADKRLRDLRDIIRELFNARKARFMLRSNYRVAGLTREQEERWMEREIQYDRILSDTCGDDDPINPRVEKIMSEVEGIFLPQLKKT